MSRVEKIVQQTFTDAYYNNTLKTIMGIKWINHYCPNSKYYMFIDDDFFLNPRLLLDYLARNVTPRVEPSLYAGFVFADSAPMRHVMSKWYISLEEWPYARYPPYASAGFYILSRQSARLFYLVSRYFQVEELICDEIIQS